jgi:hypothetical protein
VLNGRIYRAAFVPFLFALIIAAFSLGDRPLPFTSSLAPDAFDGARAFAEEQALAAHFPERQPGSRGDQALATYTATALRSLGGADSGGFRVHVRHLRAATIDGPRTLETVIAERPGASGAKPIVILAHRDAAGRGAPAELSATATLLELARVLAASETQRTIVLVSTSGGSDGAPGAADFAAHTSGSVDGAIVLGDLAGEIARKPFVVPFSDGLGSAPLRLQRIVSDAIAHEVGVVSGGPSTFGQLAHLALPLATGEQGPLLADGMPAVLVQVSGERGPATGEPVSSARLQSFGRAVLSAVYALDGAPDLQSGGTGGSGAGVPIQHKVLPEWSVRLLLGTLLLAPLLVAVDALARARRRRERVGRWVLWTLACALPFLLSAVFARLLGSTGVLAAPPGPVLPAALPLDASTVETVLAVALVLLLSWLAWPALLRRLGLRPRPDSDGAGVALLLVLAGLSIVVWVLNPFTALLLVPALNLWLLLVWTDWHPPARPAARAAALALVALGLAPFALLCVFYAHELGYSVGGLVAAIVLLFAGGYFGVVGILLSSIAFGCVAAATLVALRTRPDPLDVPGEGPPITVRGPVSYAGPGSLGGTESALRR